MIIDAVQINEDVERGATGGPEFKTALIEADGGNEIANIQWTYPRISWELGYGIQTKAQLETVIAFFYARRGRARGFLFKDWADYEIAANTLLGVGDGVVAAFQIIRVYADGVVAFSRRITRPKSGTLVVKVAGVTKTEGVHYNVSYTTGIITFTGGNIPAAAANVTCSGEFFVPVRFQSDKLNVMVEWSNAMSVPSIPIIEVRDA